MMEMIERKYDNLEFERIPNYVNDRFNVPVIRITNKEIEPTIWFKDGISIGYLSMFRFYSFQVSGTINGEGDYGSSEPTNIKNIIIDSTKEEAIKYLKIEMTKCLNSYLNTSYGKTKNKICFTYNNIIYRTNYVKNKNVNYEMVIDITHDPLLDNFIMDTYTAICNYYNIAA